MIKLQPQWISNCMQKANFLAQIVSEILKFKKIIKSDWSRVFSTTTQELDHSQPCRFYRFSNLRPKNHIDHTDRPNLSLKSVLPIYFRALKACFTNPKENYMIKL